jgi:hypothetical protein
MVERTIDVSWTQRHRLLQSAHDAELGRFTPHHLVLLLQANGVLDLPALERAWIRTQLRHPAVLSSICTGEMRWRIGHLDPAAPTYRDLLLPADVQAARAQAQAAVRTAACEPFDLARGPLARMLVIPVAPGESLVAVILEHLIGDGWSRSLLYRDLCAFYDEETGTKPVQLPAVQLHIADIVTQQNHYLDSAAGRAERTRVAAALADTGPLPTLPIRGFTGKSSIRHDHVARFCYNIDPDLCSRLEQNAQQSRLSLSTAIYAALHAALATLGDHTTVATTMSLANRADPATHNTLGWLAGFVVATSTHGSTTGTDAYLKAFRLDAVKALGAAKVPWATQIHDSAPHSFGRQPDLPVIGFVAETRRMRSAFLPRRSGGLEFREIPMPIGWTDRSICLFCIEHPNDTLLTGTYKTDWYTQSDIDALWKEMNRTMKQLAARA